MSVRRTADVFFPLSKIRGQIEKRINPNGSNDCGEPLRRVFRFLDDPPVKYTRHTRCVKKARREKSDTRNSNIYQTNATGRFVATNL